MSDISPLPEVGQSQVSDINQIKVTEGGGEQQADTAPSGISSLAELREKAPPLYKAIMESIAYEICRKQTASTERIKKILDEEERKRRR